MIATGNSVMGFSLEQGLWTHNGLKFLIIYGPYSNTNPKSINIWDVDIKG